MHPTLPAAPAARFHLVLAAEWRRLCADRASLCTLGLFAVILLASALSSGHDARRWRTHLAGLETDWQRRIAVLSDAAPASVAATDPRSAAMRTFQIARNDAPPALRQPLGGLALDASHHGMLAPVVRVTVESRHTDVRREERLANPLLQGFAMPGFATVVALLTPLAILCLCAGVVQHAREQGIWRFTAVQCPRPGVWLAATLGLRAGAIWAAAALASCLAFAMDPGATWPAQACWQLALAAFVAIWALLCALSGALAVSASSTLLLGMGVWLLTTFAIPAALAWHIDRHAPMPSRLAAVVQMRDAQQRAEAQSGQLLAAWYDANPGPRQAAASGPASHTWPVSFLPRYLAQDAEIGPLMQRFDDMRAVRYELAARWSWLSPAMQIAMIADELAGSDAPRHARFVRAVSRFEAEWRAFFVPRVMAYADVTRIEFAQLPRFATGGFDDARKADTGWRHALALVAAAVALAWLVRLLRRRLAAG